MSESNLIEKFLKDAEKQLDRKRREKPQPLNGGYRNEAWYKHLFASIGPDEAYAVVAANIKNKTFSHEPAIAIATYEAVYGRKYQSEAAREMDAQRAEIERLRAEAEELRKQVADMKGEDHSGDTESVSEFAPPAGLTQEQFKPIFYEWFEKSQGHKPRGGEYMSAWRTYCKDNEIQA